MFLEWTGRESVFSAENIFMVNSTLSNYVYHTALSLHTTVNLHVQ